MQRVDKLFENITEEIYEIPQQFLVNGMKPTSLRQQSTT